MLSYRHGFHAGNPADVLKHAVLVFCLDHLKQKEKPFLCIDTHGGAGLYPLNTGYAAKNREWEAGIGRLFRGGSPAPDQDLPSMVKRYLQIIYEAPDEKSGDGAAAGPSGIPPSPESSLFAYPGSPEIIRRLLRPGDRAVCFELHREDLRLLGELLGGDSRFSLRGEDGLAGLKSLLPPPSRRGLVLIDPSYEEKEDYARIPENLAGALSRFSTGTYITWYPLLSRYGGSAKFPEDLLGLWQGNRCQAELYTAPREQPPENSPRGMYGSGLIIYNPPWKLREALEESLPALALLMGTGKGGWQFRWEE
jgi:23S rRNA (adenine2030-N6)-methyltransferase